MRSLVALVCFSMLVMAAAARADAQSHREVARAFYEASRLQDTAALAGAVAEWVMQLQPEWRNQQHIVKEYALELVTSDAYNAANVRAITELFTEEELETLVWLVRHSAYQRYREKGTELFRRSTELTTNLFRDSLPELERKIEAERRR